MLRRQGNPLFVTKATTPSSPILSDAHRIALTYGSESLFFRVALESFGVCIRNRLIHCLILPVFVVGRFR